MSPFSDKNMKGSSYPALWLSRDGRSYLFRSLTGERISVESMEVKC